MRTVPQHRLFEWSISHDLLVLLTDLHGRLQRDCKSVASAEDGTGGLLSYMLSISSSDGRTFLRGWVAPSEAAKIEELGVQRVTLAQQAYSQAVAVEMARGARGNADAYYGLAITGPVGPDAAGVSDLPPGTVFIAVAHGPTNSVLHHQLSGDRQQVQMQAATSAICLLDEASRYF